MGFLALGLLLVSEFAVVLRVRGVSLDTDLSGRDPVSGTAYGLLLVVFALMPLFVAQRGPDQS